MDEFERYCHIEGLDPGFLRSEAKEPKEPKKEARQEHFLDGLCGASENAVRGFFRGVTELGVRAPSALRFFPWQDYYRKTYGTIYEDGKETRVKTWRELKKEGIDARAMYIVWLQDRFVVPQHMLQSLARQASTSKAKAEWETLNTEIQTVLGAWVDKNYPSAIADGIAKGLLSTVQYHHDASLAPLITEGGIASYFHARESARRDDVLNELPRLGARFSLQVQMHYNHHRRSFASSRVIPDNIIDHVSQLIFDGARLDIESEAIKAETNAIAAGVLTLQGMNVDSLPRLVTALLVPAVSVAYLSHKIRKEAQSEESAHYSEEQNAYLNYAAELARVIASSGSEIPEINLTELDRRRKDLVRCMRVVNTRARTSSGLTPWLFGASAYATQLTGSEVPGAFITGGIIAGAMTPRAAEQTRRRIADARTKGLEDIATIITTIDTAEHQKPKLDDQHAIAENLGGTITGRDHAFALTRGHPLRISSIGTGSPERSVELKKPIILEPGITFIVAGSSWGKTELCRKIALLQGKISELEIVKGIDLRQVDRRILPDVVKFVEAEPPNTQFTIAEQLRAIIAVGGDNLFMDKIKQAAGDPFVDDFHDKGDMEIYQDQIRSALFGSSVQDIERLSTTYYRGLPMSFLTTSILQSWVKEPCLIERSGTTTLFSNRIKKVLNTAAMLTLSPFFPYIDTPELAATFIKQKPSSSTGRSQGESVRWELCKAMMSEHPVYIFDEPTAHLDSQTAELIEDQLRNLAMRFPSSVIIVSTNDDALISDFRRPQKYLDESRKRRLVQSIIYAQGTKNNFKWLADKFS